MRIAKKQVGFGKEMPPSKEHVTIYFIQKGLSEKEANLFFQQHEQSGWQTKRCMPIRNWKAMAADWIWECQQVKKTYALLFLRNSKTIEELNGEKKIIPKVRSLSLKLERKVFPGRFESKKYFHDISTPGL